MKYKSVMIFFKQPWTFDIQFGKKLVFGQILYNSINIAGETHTQLTTSIQK